jgi:hypothetical protein
MRVTCHFMVTFRYIFRSHSATYVSCHLMITFRYICVSQVTSWSHSFTYACNRSLNGHILLRMHVTGNFLVKSRYLCRPHSATYVSCHFMVTFRYICRSQVTSWSHSSTYACNRSLNCHILLRMHVTGHFMVIFRYISVSYSTTYGLA